MKKIALSTAVIVIGVIGVMNVALADAPERVTVCVYSNGSGSPDHSVTVGDPAADAPAFGPCDSFGGGDYYGSDFDVRGFRFGSGRVSAADVTDALANTH